MRKILAKYILWINRNEIRRIVIVVIITFLLSYLLSVPDDSLWMGFCKLIICIFVAITICGFLCFIADIVGYLWNLLVRWAYKINTK